MGVEVYKKIITFYLDDFGRALKISRVYFYIFLQK